jgi:cell volume regulation protein A
LFLREIVKRLLKEYTVLMMFSIAFITFALAENIGGSGILAVAICGLLVRDYAFKEKEEVKKIDDLFSEMLRISVFTLLGAEVALFVTINEVLLIVLFFIFMVLSRPLFFLAILNRLNKKFHTREILLMSFTAPRGLSAAAVAPVVAVTLISIGEAAVATRLVNIIFLSLLFSILFSTIVSDFIAKRLVTSEPDFTKGIKGLKSLKPKLVERPIKEEELAEIKQEGDEVEVEEKTPKRRRRKAS